MRHPIIEEDLEKIACTDVPWNLLKNKTVLVTGCNGLIPSYVVEALLYLNEANPNQQTNVIGLARNRERTERRLGHYLHRSDFRLLIQDICQPLPAHLEADYIIHGASQASPKYYAKDPVGTMLPNVIGTHNLLSLAQSCRAEGFLFLSSGAVYGTLPPSLVTVRETDFGLLDPTDIASCYGESKRMGETMCVSWWRQFGVGARIVRIAHTYGPGMSLDDGRVFADFVADVVNYRPIAMRSAGNNARPFAYLTDTIQALFTVLLKGQNGEAYNVSNDDGICSVRELAELLVELFPERRLSIIQHAARDPSSYVETKQRGAKPDTSKLRALGWRPSIGLADGFRRTVLSFDAPTLN